jgi:hypothetical protein
VADPSWNPPLEDLLDLDWAAGPLEQLFRFARLESRLLDALGRALNGAEDVDASFLEHPEAVGIFGPPVRALDPKDVADVAAVLGEIDLTSVLAVLPPGDREATVALGASMQGFVGDPRAYLAQHFQRLRVFYERAAQRGMFVAIWWD